MMRRDRVKQRIAELIAGFDHYLAVFDQNTPFTRPGQFEYHLQTIRRRRELGSLDEAVGDGTFTLSLWETLRAWGIGYRASRLVPLDAFRAALRRELPRLKRLESLSLDSTDLDPEEAAAEIWMLIERLGITHNDAPIVSCTKTLHHLLPDLVVPMDRAYTKPFFAWDNPHFQYEQKKVFKEAFHSFAATAREVTPSHHVGGGWRTSRTKVLDNALVGYCLENALVSKKRRQPSSTGNTEAPKPRKGGVWYECTATSSS